MPAPTRYVLDTQCYIDVLRGTPDGAAVLHFLAAHVGAVDFHALVGAELLIGASGPAEATAIRQRLVNRFKPARLLTPDAADLLAAGNAVRALRARDGDHPEHARRDFWNDVVIAASCQRGARVLVSRDHDHERIARIIKHRVLTALPT